MPASNPGHRRILRNGAAREPRSLRARKGNDGKASFDRMERPESRPQAIIHLRASACICGFDFLPPHAAPQLEVSVDGATLEGPEQHAGRQETRNWIRRCTQMHADESGNWITARILLHVANWMTRRPHDVMPGAGPASTPFRRRSRESSGCRKRRGRRRRQGRDVRSPATPKHGPPGDDTPPVLGAPPNEVRRSRRGNPDPYANGKVTTAKHRSIAWRGLGVAPSRHREGIVPHGMV
jgi:hypothetical protein